MDLFVQLPQESELIVCTGENTMPEDRLSRFREYLPRDFDRWLEAGNITNWKHFLPGWFAKASRGLTDGMTISEEWNATILDKSFELNVAVTRWQFCSNSGQLNLLQLTKQFSNVLPVKNRQSISNPAAPPKVLSLFAQLQQHTNPFTVSYYLAVAAKTSTTENLQHYDCPQVQRLCSRHDERIWPGNQGHGQLHPQLQDRIRPRCTLTRQTLVSLDLLLTLWPCSSRQPVMFSWTQSAAA